MSLLPHRWHSTSLRRDAVRSHPHSGQMYIFSIVVAFLLTIVFFYAVDGVAEQIAHALQPPEAHMAIDAVLHPCGSQLVP